MAKNKIGLSIRNYRKINRMTQQKLAEMAGKTTRMITAYELGTAEPSYETLADIAKALKISRFMLLEAWLDDNILLREQCTYCNKWIDNACTREGKYGKIGVCWMESSEGEY